MMFDNDEVTTADQVDRPQKALDREMFQTAFRQEKAGGGMLVEPGFGGVRQGYARPKKSKVKMTVAQALNQILKNKTTFSNRAE